MDAIELSRLKMLLLLPADLEIVEISKSSLRHFIRLEEESCGVFAFFTGIAVGVLVTGLVLPPIIFYLYSDHFKF